MGRAALPDGEVAVAVGDRSWPAVHVSMGNPHAVAFVADLDQAGDLLRAPAVTPPAAYPDGANVEFVVDRAPAMSPCASTSAAPARPVPAAPAPAP